MPAANARQIHLPMLTYYESPKLVPIAVVQSMTCYRDAVKMCWATRSRASMTRRQLAEEIGSYGSHITDYLNDDPSKRELPARYIAEFEIACGNRLISQWIALRSELTVLEEHLLLRRSA